ncbi:MAG: class I SAM-dependent methyltransferase [Anaerolineaceae bacterium]
MSSTLVREYYTSQVRQEWRRLIRDAYHRLELDTTLHFLEKYLPKTGLILDAGSGPGRYTLELARRGYTLNVLDLTPTNLDFAKRQIKKAGLPEKVREFREGSITDLSAYPSNTFDAVVCLGGPLSHVVEKESRKKAIKELIRVAKPGAPIFVSVMSRLSVMVVELMLFQHEIGAETHLEIRSTGNIDGSSGFTACHFFLPEELHQEFEGESITILEMAGLEGLGSRHNQKINELAKEEKRWAAWLATHYITCTHPAVVGLSEHMLIVVQKLPNPNSLAE